jgi:O-antigen/teichoic acid export membrane protein
VAPIGTRGLFGDAVALQSAQVANLVLGMATFWILGNVLPVAEFGLYTLLLVLVRYLFTAAASWTSQGFVRFGREEYTREARLRDAAGARLLLVGAAVGALVVPLVLWRRPLLGLADIEGRHLELVLLLLALQLAFEAVTTTLQAVASFRQLALYQITDKALALPFLGGAWLAGPVDAATALVAISAGRLLALLLALAGMRASWLWPPRLDRTRLAEMWRYSGPLLVSATLGQLPVVGGPYLVNHFLGKEEVARYNVAYQVFGFYQALTTTVLITVLVPMLTDLVSAGRRAALERLTQRLVGQLVLLNQMAVGIAVVVVIPTLPLLLPRYEGSLPLLAVLFVSIPGQLLTGVYSSLLSAFKVSRPIAVVNVVGGLGFLVAYWLLIPRLGVMALALVWVVWYLVSSTAYLVAVRSRSGLGRARELLPALAATTAGGATALTCIALGPGAAVVASLAGTVVLALAARRAGWFVVADAELLEQFGLPRTVSRLAGGLYRLLSRPDPRAV